MFDFENSIIGRIFPGAGGVAFLKDYYLKRRSISTNPEEYDKLFQRLYASIIEYIFPKCFEYAEEIRLLCDVDNGLISREDCTILLDDDNLRAFIANANKAVEFNFLIESGEIEGRFHTITKVSLVYFDGKQHRRTGKGTEINALFHFQDLFLMLDEMPGGFKSKITKEYPHFDKVQAIVIEYFSNFINSKIARRTKEGAVVGFARYVSTSTLPGILYNFIKNREPKYNLDCKEWVAAELLEMFGLKTQVSREKFASYLKL